MNGDVQNRRYHLGAVFTSETDPSPGRRWEFRFWPQAGSKISLTTMTQLFLYLRMTFQITYRRVNYNAAIQVAICRGTRNYPKERDLSGRCYIKHTQRSQGSGMRETMAERASIDERHGPRPTSNSQRMRISSKAFKP